MKIEDDFNWKIPTTEVQNLEEKTENSDSCGAILKYVGGVDLSFSKADPSVACATLVVLDLNTLQVVYEDFFIVKLHTPYIPGFLAFREVLFMNFSFQFLFVNLYHFVEIFRCTTSGV